MDNIGQQKEFSKKILQEYVKIEESLDNSYNYYCHTEYDSNVTEFEGLSNSNKIVLKSKINSKYIPIIIGLFQDIYDNNYWRLSKSYIDGYIYFAIDDDFQLTDEEIEKLNNYDLQEWMTFLDKYSNKYIVKKNKSEYFVEEIRIYKQLPNIDHKYSIDSNKEQIVYTLADIVNLIL